MRDVAQELHTLPPLQSNDLIVIGAIIQTFCFIDFNLRRALEVMHVAKLLPPKAFKQYPDISDAGLTDALIQSLKDQKAEAEDIDDTIRRLEQIKYYRGFRNLVSHFSLKRHLSKDVYVCVSKSDRDARDVLGESLSDYPMHIAIIGRPELLEIHKAVAN